MSNCSNCYNGCTEIVSDKCVMYTGLDIPVLGIKKGDSLSYVEQSLITFLTSVLNGSGITIEIDQDLYCPLVSQYLQQCSTVTALDLFKALVQAACNIQEQINTINSTLATLNADYDVDCLTGVTDTSDTHDVLQAVITKLCEINVSLTALAVDLDTNYVKIADINSYIEAYINSQETANRFYTRMVPYCPIPYIGSLSFFDATGAGIVNTEWEKIYICNGLNGTPDFRGRSPIGAIVGVPGGAMSSIVDPAADPAFNPNYAVGTIAGSNKITLTVGQIPAHSHTISITDPGHTHVIAHDEQTVDNPLGANEYLARVKNDSSVSANYSLQAAVGGAPDVGKVKESTTGVSASIGETGGGGAHSNIAPVLGTYFIMYIP